MDQKTRGRERIFPIAMFSLLAILFFRLLDFQVLRPKELLGNREPAFSSVARVRRPDLSEGTVHRGVRFQRRESASAFFRTFLRNGSRLRREIRMRLRRLERRSA